jgi:16S rRNA (guanine(966)-N(2))-methyltransferase RsmD
MLDRVREALFNILRNVTEDRRVLDLFSGSGSLGLEALSRGARNAVFVEGNDRLARLVERNVEKCHFEDRAEVLNCDVMTLPVRFPPAGWKPADLVLADPPYAMIDDPNDRGEFFRVLERLLDYWIAPAAILVLHHRPMPHVIWPTDKFEVWDQRIYGQSQITFFDAPGAEDDE